MSNFGIRIKTLCLEKGIAQKDLAEKIGVSRQSLYLWIKGERTPDKENIQKLAEFFNVSPESISGTNDNISLDDKTVAHSYLTKQTCRVLS